MADIRYDCRRCFGRPWVCEIHKYMAWEGDYGCGCGAPGMPCPLCNASDQINLPKMPPGFIVENGLIAAGGRCTGSS
jgi:hypothetical protein